MTDIEQRLRDLAEKATGPESGHLGDGTCCRIGVKGCAAPTTAFRAATTPEAVIALLDTIRDLTDERDDLARVHRAECDAIDKAVRELIPLRARLSRYEEVVKAIRREHTAIQVKSVGESTADVIALMEATDAALAALDTEEPKPERTFYDDKGTEAKPRPRRDG